jgi:5-methyltetrahydropteroyltriglutamate--homocysteine methyltransferase
VHIAAVRGEPNPPARLTVRDLLEFATVRGAQNAALLHKIGTPTPGKQADVVVIRAEDVNTMPLTNAISTVVSHAHAGNIEAVFIAGDIRIEIVTDGEYSKPGFFTYIRERFDGFEARPSQKLMIFRKEVAAFPEYYAQYFKEAMIGGAILPIVPVVCTGPVKYKGEAKLQIDIANVKAAAKARRCPGSSRVSAGYGTVGRGRQRVLHDRRGLLSRARRRAEQGIPHDRRRGTLSQVDDPFLPDIFVEPRLDDKQMRRRAGIYVEATNVALSGIPAERVRFHTCYGINEGPRLYEADLPQIIEYVLQIGAGSFSFETANPRHEHEYHLFEQVKVPNGKVLCTGVITHASNIVEHPEVIAERPSATPTSSAARTSWRGPTADFHRRRSTRPRSPHRGVGEVHGDAKRRRDRNREAMGLIIPKNESKSAF